MTNVLMCKNSQQLTLVSLFAAPTIRIVDEQGISLLDKYYEVDSTIQLTCIVRHISMMSSVVYWIHNNNSILNYDVTRGGIRWVNVRGNSIKKISIEREKIKLFRLLFAMKFNRSQCVIQKNWIVIWLVFNRTHPFDAARWALKMFQWSEIISASIFHQTFFSLFSFFNPASKLIWWKLERTQHSLWPK